MSRTVEQAATAAALALLDAPTPLHPRDANGRVIADALGRPRVLILPTRTDDPAGDHALACAIARLINEAAGVAPEDVEPVEARPGRAVFGRRVGGVVGA
ncbi:hypothetical protein [Methylobacterium isbiliense]|uniref:Uncharacterized protein n=1 Tax=Methylobacterium isbiliense TaxID=315478 RepID=A0ABQ4SE09_9HYPH|nr:hypothetical protein [Methylobacterium isbiliense]MDN3622565.1 hypothetical protein [Methylobacterium isbiliense]GJE01451.1 hypothetical protein GMJLKIPL_3382 [Methylobacterium isbiliense]